MKRLANFIAPSVASVPEFVRKTERRVAYYYLTPNSTHTSYRADLYSSRFVEGRANRPGDKCSSGYLETGQYRVQTIGRKEAQKAQRGMYAGVLM